MANYNKFLQEVVDCLQVRLGGPEAFAERLVQDYRDAEPGSPTSIRMGGQLLDLFQQFGTAEDEQNLEELRQKLEQLEAEGDNEASDSDG